MQVGGRRWYGEVDRTHPHLREHVLAEIRERGPARLAALRRRRPQGRDVGLEAGQADARPAVEPRRARRRRAPGLPAPLRPPRAGAAAGDPRRAEPVRAGEAPRARAPRRSRARSLDRGGRRRALAVEGRDRAGPARRRRARRRRHPRAPRRRRRRSSSPCRRRHRARPSGADAAGAPLAVRQPALGPAVRAARARLRSPDRGLQARARAAVRLLRAAVPPRRQHRRPRRPQVGACVGHARRSRLPPRAGRSRLGRPRRCARPRTRPVAARDRARDGPCDEVGVGRRGPEDRGPRPAARRVGDGRALDGPRARLAPARPDRDRRACRSSSSSGAGSAATTSPSSIASSGTSVRCSSGTPTSGRSRTTRSYGR